MGDDTEIGCLTCYILLRATVDIKSQTNGREEIDIRMVIKRKTHRGHQHEIVEILPFEAIYFVTRTIARDLIPNDTTAIKHRPHGQPMDEPPLVLQP